MSQIVINSHNFLGKLSVIKNYLFVVLESISKDKTESHKKAKDYLQKAYQANEELIALIKQKVKL